MDDDFREIVWQKGRELYRDMPWRETESPYAILVSEMMLQQTQVERVIPKFHQFMEAFPTISEVASAPLADVLVAWSGLGYNRRAKYLHEAARHIVAQGGTFPLSVAELTLLPGVGKNTASAVCAYAYNQPVAFVETNIRSVYFHHYFSHASQVSDAELLAVVARTVDHDNPRQWYWALMDYGAFLKKQGAGQLSKSAHYKKQAPLKGSVREMRGAILRALAQTDMDAQTLRRTVAGDERFEKALAGLLRDGLVEQRGIRLQLPHKTV